jgi:uncharacterized membrane protein YbaN (DUF454 family)
MSEPNRPERRPASRLPRWLLIAVGVLAVALGTVGIIVPILPTTPFLLLAAACFLRSSDRLYRWLTTHPLFGKFIRDYREHHAIPLRVKIPVLILLWLTIGISIVWVAEALWLRLLLGAIAAGVTIHLVSLRNEPPPAQPAESTDEVTA